MSSMTPLVDLDGLKGEGGCEYCNADFEVVIDGSGLSHIYVRHDDGCQMIGRSEALIGDSDVVDAALRSVLDQWGTPNRAQRRSRRKKGK